MFTIVGIMIMLSVGTNVFSGVAFPESPCPNTFSYEGNSPNETYGIARFKNDLSGYYKVEVNLTLPAYTTANIAVKRVSSTEAVQNGEDIVYHVSFPPLNVLPNVASIVFNEKLYCSGIRNATPALGGMTTLNAAHFFSTQCGMTSPTTEVWPPWLIAMFHLQGISGEYKFKCAANLVSKRHVVTAAHCVRTSISTNIPRDTIMLVLGNHNISSWAVRSEIRDVQEIHVHLQYKHSSDADIALIVMAKTVEFSSLIQPLCLWMEDTNLNLIVGSNGTVVGWGRDEFDNAYVPEPKEQNMPIVSQLDCLRSDQRFFKITSNRTFCAGTRTGEGVCTGDSGGGFVIKRNGRWTLRGIVSSALEDFQTHSCDLNNYMVFADVAKVMTWLVQIMAQ